MFPLHDFFRSIDLFVDPCFIFLHLILLFFLLLAGYCLSAEWIYFQRHCYYFWGSKTKKVDWDTANALCKNMKSSMTSVLNEEENIFVSSYLKK